MGSIYTLLLADEPERRGNGIYTFLPWVRSGQAAAIKPGTGPSGQRRLRVNLSVNVTSGATGPTATTPVAKVMELLGPGDVVGFDPGEVIRTEPPDRSSGVEPNYFAAVDFDTPELPWLFTPDRSPAAGDRLRPWICLVVVRRDRGRLTPPAAGPLPVLNVDDAPNELPPLGEAWAWAHAQLLRASDSIDTVLAGSPARTLSRLLCPRRLLPRTSYLACVVPTFEAGRQAGLGLPVTSADQPAWAWPPPAQVTLPVYYHWEFTTGEDDFETLAQRLEPQPLPNSFGFRDVEVAVPPISATSPPPAEILGFEGALRATQPASRPWPDAHRTAFQTAVRSLIEALAGTAGLAVQPPVYGAVQAGSGAARPRLPAAPPWLVELNLDPRYRAAAALGALVVQDQQEQLMAAAWEQLGEVQRANQRMYNAQLARVVEQRIYEKRLGKMTPALLLQVTEPVHGRVRTGTTTVTVRRVVRDSALPESTTFAPFRRVTRPTGPITRRVAGTEGTKRVRELVIGLAQNAISLPLVSRAAGAVSVEQVSARVALPAISYGAAGRTAVEAATGWYVIDELRRYVGTQAQAQAHALAQAQAEAEAQAVSSEQLGALAEPIPQPNGTGEVIEVRRRRLGMMRSRFKEAAGAHQAHLGVGAPPPPPPPPPPALSVDAVASSLVGANGRLNPARTIPARALDTVPAAARSSSPEPLAPLVASPTFPQPMYEPLRDLSQDYLVPGCEHVPPDSIAVLQPNPKFIEAYMAGLNHEMTRELVWRGFPTTGTGTYFRTFWDVRARPGAAGPTLPPLHEWRGALGSHASATNVLMLLVRGELVRRYPNVTVYAVKAATRTSLSTLERYPLFRCSLKPDMLLVAFDLSIDEVRGSSDPQRPGWFFVIQAQPTEPRFGLDAVRLVSGQPQYGGQPTAWRNLSWGHLAADAASFIALRHAPAAARFGALTLEGATYGQTSAHMARVMLRPPLRIAMHAAALLPSTTPITPAVDLPLGGTT